MKSLRYTRLFFEFINAIKPVLTKLVPIKMLRAGKSRVVERSIKKMAESKIIPFERNAFPDGINLVGSVKSETGLGQSMRLIADALAKSDYPFTIYNYLQVSQMQSGDSSWDAAITGTYPYNINLIHINPYELPIAFSQIGQGLWDKHYNIGFWPWELEEFPKSWIPAIGIIDEIWAPSDFSGIAVKKVTDKPVFSLPYPISAPVSAECDRAFFGLPEDKFLFLAMYDSNSAMERKNPIGALRAFKKAFAPDCEGVGLVLKINNPQQEDLDIIRAQLAGYKNIYFITGVLPKEQVNSLIACADAFVSLHRAEGFGLPPAEAMLLGTPVIATNWSATCEFMTADTACLVDFDFVTIKEKIGPFEPGQRWAEPSVSHAAKHMQKLYNNREFAREMAEKARKYICEKLSLAQAVEKINSRISWIYKEHSNKI